ncbi:hypothetical protein ACFW6S_00355 [Streptomyces sp. NPDC058740]|uniref:hypothetical protein n=1 Tax=Streptomyces sp. NPDC058740 TaxID=3346619 RepID=UPI003698CF3B
MEQQLVARMREYLDAGTAMDVDRLDALYDPGFENVRVDLEGRTVTLTKRLFMDRFRALKAQGRGVGESVDDVSFPAAGRHGDQGSVVMRRV